MTERRPNILLFTTDQHRGDGIGLSLYSWIETPNVDGWISEGACFLLMNHRA